MSFQSHLSHLLPSVLKDLVVRIMVGLRNTKRSFSTRGVRQLDLNDNAGLPRVLIVGPGEKEIPVKGWGAVELIIANQAAELPEQGFSVGLLNSWNLVDWLRAFRWKPIIVLCHYDVLAARANAFSKLMGSKLVVLTHYAYAQQPERWDPQFSRYAKAMSKANAFVALNEQIALTMKELYPNLRVEVIPNGIATDLISSAGLHRGAVCLGKVEPRKRQVEIARQLLGTENIRFIGEVVDPAFETLTKEQKGLFIGAWAREGVERELSSFSTLFLLGDGEADALVLYEAQAAGLRIVTNENSVGSQERDCPWIEIVGPGTELKSILKAAARTLSLEESKLISKYAKSRYSSKISTSKYASLFRSLL